MAAPRLRLRRGTNTPVGNVTTALSGEPFFDTSASNLYIASGASSFVHIGGTTYTARVDEVITAAAATTSGEVTILSRTDNSGGGSVTFDVAATASNSTYTWPAAPDAVKILQSDANGDLAWVLATDQSITTAWTISDGTTTEGIGSTNTVEFIGGSGIATTYTTNDNKLTINLDINELVVLGGSTATQGEILSTSDFIPVYDVTSNGSNKKVSIANLSDIVYTNVSGDILITAAGVATIQENSVALGTDTTGNYVSTLAVTANGGISTTGATTGETIAHELALDIDGMTDIGAVLADADLIIVDDGGNGTNRKAAVTRIPVYTFSKVSADININSDGVAAIQPGVIVDADINSSAEIAVSKLANGTARQLLQTDAAGTGVEWASNIDVPGTLDVSSTATFDNNVTIQGDLTVNGTTTTLSTTNTVVSDRLLELANGTTGSPTADAGIIIERGSDSNIFIGYDEGLDLFVTGTTTATGSSNDVSPTPIAVLCGALKITDTAGTNESIISYLAAGSAPDGATAGRYLQNITVDAGTY
jgi:hypothetical protein